MNVPLMNISCFDAPWCVDGRNDSNVRTKGPQLLGGSVLPILLALMFRDKLWIVENIREEALALVSSSFRLGVHRGHHKNIERRICDCGFGDRLDVILKTALDKKTEYVNLIVNLIDVYKLHDLFEMDELKSAVQIFFEKLEIFLNGDLSVLGEDLIGLLEILGADVVNLEGEHEEVACLINLKEGKTLDINALHKSGIQVFNLDLWVLFEYAKQQDIDQAFVIVGALILYLATHEVLVINKGKTALPIEIVQ